MIIAYFNDGPSQGAGTVKRYGSLRAVKHGFREFLKDSTISDNAHASIYCGMDDEDWQEALDFAGVGCPFDHPTHVINLGPNGGIRLIEA